MGNEEHECAGGEQRERARETSLSPAQGNRLRLILGIKVSCSFIEIPFCLHGDAALALEGELARGLLVNAGDGNAEFVSLSLKSVVMTVLIVEVHDLLPCSFGDRRVMDGAPLGEGGGDGLLIPAEEFRDLAVHALHGNVCHRFGTLVCGVFLSEHQSL